MKNFGKIKLWIQRDKNFISMRLFTEKFTARQKETFIKFQKRVIYTCGMKSLAADFDPLPYKVLQSSSV